MGCPTRKGRPRKRTFCGKSPHTKSKQTLPESDREDFVPQTPKVSASRSKISGMASDEDNLQQVRNGYSLIDVEILISFLSEHILCPLCSGKLDCKMDLLSAHGFANRFVGYCATCQADKDLFWTSKVSEREAPGSVKVTATPYEVNCRMIAFIRSQGKGHAALKTFSKFLNMPPPMTPKNYGKLFRKHATAVKRVANASMAKAAADIRGMDSSDCAVSVDGTWQKRGHASHNGVVTTISVDTGKCLDVEVLSNACKGCEKRQGMDQTTDAYIQWKADHRCANNHSGSAGAMEGVGATRIFTRSETKHGLRYVKYLGDGDSSSFKSVQMSKPYECDIEKLECVGHVQKRLGTRLRKLRQNHQGKKLADGKGVSGAGRLTEKKIDTLQNYFGLAIRQNCGNLQGMQTSILASLYHVASTDQNPNHNLCPDGEDSWCRYLKDPAMFKHKHGLPDCIVAILEPIYNDLAEPGLLSRCLHGKTQNANECLNKMIWDRCSKSVYVGRETCEEAVNSAVSHYNDGDISISLLMNALGITPGTFTERAAKSTDSCRILHSDLKCTPPVMKRRKILRAKRKGFHDVKEAEEGNVYEKGGH